MKKGDEAIIYHSGDDRAIVGIATGSPRSFKILPTMRVGNLVCAEIDHSGGISYLVPNQ
jgi:hypothetical protein